MKIMVLYITLFLCENNPNSLSLLLLLMQTSHTSSNKINRRRRAVVKISLNFVFAIGVQLETVEGSVVFEKS